MSVEDRLRRGLADNAQSIEASTERELTAVLARNRRRTQLRWVGYATTAAVAAVVTVIAFAFVGQRQPTTPPATPERATALAGRYVVDVPSSKQAKRLHVAGRWVIVMENDGGLAIVPPAGYTGIVSGASYRIEGDRVRTNSFIDSPGCQRTSDQSGLYEWQEAAGIVEFVAVKDACMARRIIFSGQPWVSVP
jgi:hypothetical protein